MNDLESLKPKHRPRDTGVWFWSGWFGISVPILIVIALALGQLTQEALGFGKDPELMSKTDFFLWRGLPVILLAPVFYMISIWEGAYNPRKTEITTEQEWDSQVGQFVGVKRRFYLVRPSKFLWVSVRNWSILVVVLALSTTLYR